MNVDQGERKIEIERVSSAFRLKRAHRALKYNRYGLAETLTSAGRKVYVHAPL